MLINISKSAWFVKKRAATSSSLSFRLPQIITVLFCSTSFSVSPKPIPVAPPVMSIFLWDIFIRAIFKVKKMESSYHGTSPSSLKNFPVGPSASIVASFTMGFAPSAAVLNPAKPLRSVAV